MLTQSRDRLQKLLDRIGPHDRSNELLRTITSSLADTRKALGQGPERSSDDEPLESKTQTVGEALRPSKFLTDLSHSPTQGLRVGGMVPSLTQTEEQDQAMRRLHNKLTRSASGSTIRNQRPLSIEPLEGRQLLAAMISVSDGTINEIGSPIAFIAAGSGGLDAPLGIALGSDGNVYVAGNNGAVRRYNGNTGQFINTFVSQGSGGLSGVYGLAFGPDGNLYVPSENTDSVLRYNGTTGVFMNSFVTSGSGGLDAPREMVFGPDGSLYVSSMLNHAVYRYGGPTSANPGSPLPASIQSGAIFVSPQSGGLYSAQNLAFGPDSHLYVTGGHSNDVLRYDGSTGAFIDRFVAAGDGVLGNARDIAFDQDGRLYVSDNGNGVHRYDRQGAFVDDLIPNSVSMAISKPYAIAFDSQGALLIAGQNTDSVMRYDRGVVVNMSEAGSSSVNFSLQEGTAKVGENYAALFGTVTFQPGQSTRRILLAAHDDLKAESTETFVVQLSNATVCDRRLKGSHFRRFSGSQLRWLVS